MGKFRLWRKTVREFLLSHDVFVVDGEALVNREFYDSLLGASGRALVGEGASGGDVRGD